MLCLDVRITIVAVTLCMRVRFNIWYLYHPVIIHFVWHAAVFWLFWHNSLQWYANVNDEQRPVTQRILTFA